MFTIRVIYLGSVKANINYLDYAGEKGGKDYLRPWNLSHSKVGKNDFRNSKGANRYLINPDIIPDISLTNLQFRESDRITTMEIWSEYHFGIRDKSYDFGSNRFRKSGKCCPLWTTSPRIGNGCDIATQRLLPVWNLGGWYYATYRSPVRRWFPVGNWCVVMGTELWVQSYQI